jgi:hypothetical protein
MHYMSNFVVLGAAPEGGWAPSPMSAFPIFTAALIVFGLGLIFLVVFLIVRSSRKSRRNFEAYQNQNRNASIPGAPYPNPMPNTQFQGAQYPVPPQFAQDAPSFGFALLGFFIPIVGFILYLSWNMTLPFRARSAGKGAIAGIITYVLLVILSIVIFMLFI